MMEGMIPERERRWLEAESLRRVGSLDASLIETWAHQLKSGQPLAYVLGFQPFLTSEYAVTPDVLIPRPETEFVVNQTLRWLEALGQPPLRGAELGLGSGVISIELLKHFPTLQMSATEISPGAIQVARKNASSILGAEARRLEIRQVAPHETFETFEAAARESQGRYNFLVMNPPYLRDLDEEVETGVRTSEPRHALFAPESDPLFFYREAAARVSCFLKAGGYVFCEIPHERADQIEALFFDAGMGSCVKNDLTGRPRWLVARRTH